MTAQGLVLVAMEKAGGLNRLARMMAVAPNAVAQWRDGRNLPEWYRANRLSEISGEPLDVVQHLLTAAHQERSERRRRPDMDTGSSRNNTLRRPLSHAGIVPKALIPVGAKRLERAVAAGGK